MSKKLINEARSLRVKAKMSIENLKKKTAAAHNNLEIPVQDRNTLAKRYADEVAPEIDKNMARMADLMTEMDSTALSAYDASRTVLESNKLAARAAVITPMLASMTNEALLGIFKDRHGSKMDRIIVEEAISLRIAADPQNQKFANQFHNTRHQMIEKLPEEERAAWDQIALSSKLNDYGNLCDTEARLLLLEQTRGSLKLEESVKLKRVATDLAQLEAELFGGTA